MKTFDVLHLPPMITLGYDGENNWRPNRFDCSSLLENHPNGTISLWLLPNGETQAFPVALEREGNTVVWTPLSEEMTAATGAFQIVCVDGTDVGKSAVVLFRVGESILPGAEHPADVPSWATQTVARAEAAADRAEGAAESIDPEQIEQTIQTAVEAYLDEHPIDAPVTSVNGKTGAVVLNATDVGALPADTPIPDAVTEQTVSGWGFTKNTGTYSKPSGGIPKTDLASDVQTSLGKADTALQQHQSLSGYATETWVGQQIAAIPDELPIVTASDNGKSLVVENGVWGKGYQAARIPRVAMASTDTTPTIDPNKLYVFPEMASLTPTLNTPSDATIVNEYHFIFDSGATATVLTLPATVLQPDGFTVEANMHYEISILEGAMTAQGWAVTST